MSLGLQEPSICLVERALTVAIFRSVSTSSPKETRNFVTAVNTSSEITLFRLVPVIEDVPRIWLLLRQRSPVAGPFRLRCLWSPDSGAA